MANIQSININFSVNTLYLVAGLLVLALYSFFIYKYTIPKVSNFLKYFLITLRTLSLIILFLIIFEPIFTIVNSEKVEPVSLFFLDNSRSISAKDSSERAKKYSAFLSEAENNVNGEKDFYLFGKDIRPLKENNNISFTQPLTNFTGLINFIKNDNQNISSVVILSDGIITEGVNPVYSAEKLDVPVYTVGIGDTLQRNDIEIKNVLYNDILYLNKPTVIKASIINKGFAGKQVKAILKSNGEIVDDKNINLSHLGTTNISFDYSPNQKGENRIEIDVSRLEGETSYENNKKIFFVNVLDTKIKILLVSASPSNDFSFIKNSLQGNKNFEVSSILQISPDKFSLSRDKWDNKLDSAKVLFLVGFPGDTTPNDLRDKILNAIKEKKKPFFISLSQGVDINRLKYFEKVLPFEIKNGNPNIDLVQPQISDPLSPLVKFSADDPSGYWNNLPPVYMMTNKISAKPGSEIKSKIKIRNVFFNAPLILTRSLGKSRSISITAKDIWKWKLQSQSKSDNLFDNLIISSAKWLNTNPEDKQVIVKTSKRIYTLGEKAEFTAQVYDQTLTPIDNAEVKVKISKDDETYEVNLNSAGSGIYEGSFENSSPGEYTYTGTASINGRIIGDDGGKFSVGEIDIELLNTRTDQNLLKLLAKASNGNYYYINNYSELFRKLNRNVQNNSREKISTTDINLWSSEWVLIILVLLFAVEWFLRKKSGMI